MVCIAETLEVRGLLGYSWQEEGDTWKEREEKILVTGDL